MRLRQVPSRRTVPPPATAGSEKTRTCGCCSHLSALPTAQFFRTWFMCKITHFGVHPVRHVFRTDTAVVHGWKFVVQPADKVLRTVLVRACAPVLTPRSYINTQTANRGFHVLIALCSRKQVLVRPFDCTARTAMPSTEAPQPELLEPVTPIADINLEQAPAVVLA